MVLEPTFYYTSKFNTYDVLEMPGSGWPVDKENQKKKGEKGEFKKREEKTRREEKTGEISARIGITTVALSSDRMRVNNSCTNYKFIIHSKTILLL